MIKIYKDKDSKDTSNDLETFNLGDVPILYRYRGRIPIYFISTMALAKKSITILRPWLLKKPQFTVFSLVRYAIIKERKIAAATNSSLESISHRKSLSSTRLTVKFPQT